MSPRYRWYVVGMLWCISVFNYADRQAIFSVLPLIQQEMTLSAVQLGLLGSAFAWVYGACAPLAGIIVDRVARKKAILFGLHAWSVICAATALCKTFPQLFVFRALEGLGETFYYPASMSLVSDYHAKDTRSRAMGFHQTSVYFGTIGGGFFAGLIGQHYGWRWSFIVFGTLGILLGVVLNRYLIEPVRGATELGVKMKKIGAMEFYSILARTPSAWFLMLAFISNNFVAVVLLAWMPKFLYDKFQLSLAEAGLYATIFAQVASMMGAPSGGFMADRLRLRHPGGRMLVQAAASFAAAPFVLLCGASNSLAVTLAALFCWGLFKGHYDANIFASLYDVIRPEARGTAAGTMNMVGWLGGGSAPVIIGFAATTYGLGFAISSACLVYVLGGTLLLISGLFFARGDIARVMGTPNEIATTG